MEPAHSPAYLRSVLAAVDEFVAALESLMELYVVNTDFGLGLVPAVLERDDADPDELKVRSAAVARAAGRAAAATKLTNSYVMVAGTGTIDPIAAWHSMTQPKPVLTYAVVSMVCQQMVGRLEGQIAQAEIEALPSLQVESFHPLVVGAASRLWRDGHRRLAIAAAAEALVTQVKSVLGRNELQDSALWQQAFSASEPEAGKPRLRWPGAHDDLTVKSMRDGLRQFAPGAQMTIRNPATHDAGEPDVQTALERLAVLSLLARWVDACDVVRHPDDAS
jgi:hypothetical protein